jgi:hypothetical protein
LLLCLVTAGWSAAQASATETRRVAGTVKLVSSVCGGGAAISQEQIARLPPPQPIGGKELLVVAGEQISPSQPAARFTTRPDGTFVTHLPPGKWCFFDAARKLNEPKSRSADAGPPRARPVEPPSSGTDASCLDAERHRCDLVLAVKSDVSQVEITFNHRCPEPWNQPCYRGPMPP